MENSREASARLAEEKGKEKERERRPERVRNTDFPARRDLTCKVSEAPSLSLAGGEEHYGQPASKLTRNSDVREHCLLAVLDAADLREVGIQSQVKKAAEEGEDTHGNAIVAGIAIAVENAVLL